MSRLQTILGRQPTDEEQGHFDGHSDACVDAPNLVNNGSYSKKYMKGYEAGYHAGIRSNAEYRALMEKQVVSDSDDDN
jgi:hypothetical protein